MLGERVAEEPVEDFHIQISEESFLGYVQKLIASGVCACIIRRKVVLVGVSEERLKTFAIRPRGETAYVKSRLKQAAFHW